MKNTSILNRIIGLALSLALLVSMMPVLASEAYAAGETVHIYTADGNPAVSGVDYTIDGDGVRYNLNADNLTVTTNGLVVKACFALNSGVEKVNFKDCSVFLDGSGYMIKGDVTTHNQTINISDDCEFLCNIDGLAMNFDCTGGHEVTFTSSDKNNSLKIKNYGQAIEVNKGGLNFSGELNATITGETTNKFIEMDKDFYITDNAKLKMSCEHPQGKTNDGIIIGGKMTMDGNSMLDATARGTAITVNGGKLLVRENASLKASSYHYVVAKTTKEATFDTTGRVELTNYHSEGLLCEKLKVLNREGTVLIRGTESTAIKLINEGDITLGKNIGMYASTNLNEPESSIMKEFTNITWEKDGYNYYHPHFVINGVNTPIKSILIKDANRTSDDEETTDEKIEKLEEGLASADAKIKELDEQFMNLVSTLMNKKVKITKLKSSSKKKVTLKIDKHSIAQTYQIRYKTAGKSWKTITTKKLSRTFTKLKRHKKFYVKVRGIYKSGTMTKYTPWSVAKSVKVK